MVNYEKFTIQKRRVLYEKSLNLVKYSKVITSIYFYIIELQNKI